MEQIINAHNWPLGSHVLFSILTPLASFQEVVANSMLVLHYMTVPKSMCSQVKSVSRSKLPMIILVNPKQYNARSSVIIWEVQTLILLPSQLGPELLLAQLLSLTDLIRIVVTDKVSTIFSHQVKPTVRWRQPNCAQEIPNARDGFKMMTFPEIRCS